MPTEPPATAVPAGTCVGGTSEADERLKSPRAVTVSIVEDEEEVR
jgi:hypothetical protein